MKIALINGSPKVNKSSSGALLEDLKYYLNGKTEIVECEMHVNSAYEKVLDELNTAEAWVFAYPLYVDGIPGHLLSFLAWLEEKGVKTKAPHVYSIVNCGFYEGVQNEIALKILQNWCAKTGCIWSGGIGVGGGGGLGQLPKMERGQGPKAPIDKALNEIADKMLRCEALENKYVSIDFPRSLYKMGAQIGWRQMIKANGGSTRDLDKRPE